MEFAKFMSSSTGRGLRIIAGLGLIVWGLLTGNIVLVVVGVLPLAAGVFNFCLIAPLLGVPFMGNQLEHRS